MKSEPDAFGIDDLKRLGQDGWDGVRNYQARNMMRDDMKVGDLAFFYHSNCKEPGIVGIMKVVSEPYPDPTAFDPKSKYYDEKSTPEKPRWFQVDLAYVRHLKCNITLQSLKTFDELENLALVRRGNRLSIMPVAKAEWDFILTLEK